MKTSSHISDKNINAKKKALVKQVKRSVGTSAGRISADEKQSDKDFARPQYRKLMRKIKAGDTLVVKSIDRLGRNYAEILDTMTLSERWSLTS